MPKPKFPHLHHERTRHPGSPRVWYVRVGHGPRIRLREAYGTKEFFQAYQAALSSQPAEAKSTRRSDTLEHLIEEYKRSSEFKALSSATRKQRWNFYRGTLKEAGAYIYSDIRRDDIVSGRERRAHTPSQANNWLDAMRALFKWAVEHGRAKADPTEGVKNVRRPKSDGFIPWSEGDVAAYERRWPTGTRERLAMYILLYTGLRRGDAARLSAEHKKSGGFMLRTEKTGQLVTIPIHPALAAVIEASPCGQSTYIARQDGKPMVKEGFGNWFREACAAAGVAGSAHGIRKLAASRLVDAGVTEAQLEAIMGWKPGSGMARIYTRQRDTERLARQAMDKLLSSSNPLPRKSGAGENAESD